MDESRAQAYANLIHQLLSCPNGEESQILQANSELVDAEFLQVCEVIADNLAAEGQENAANFLRDLATQLGQLLGMNDDEDGDNSEAENPREYLEFIRELLQKEESYGGFAAVYPILRQRQHLLNARFAEILQQVAEKLIADKDSETIASIVGIIENLSIHISNFPLGNRANNIDIAIAGYQIVLSHCQPGSEKWAQTQNNLAVAYSDKITGNRGENIDRAIACYQQALEVYTREDFPEGWATTQNNLGSAYKNKITGNRGENIDRAIACYQLALEVYTREDFPEKWAGTQNNLAIAYRNKITGNRGENIDRAIACYLQALEVRTREDFPEGWAETKNNLANAYYRKITGNRGENIDRAIACYQQALEVRTREDFPQDWAMTQNNLAVAYSDKITGNRGENIDRAIACYQQALEVRTREDFPEGWATTQNNLGSAYSDKITGNRGENIDRAIACYQLALEVYTREDFPEKWATTQNNLGLAYKNKITGNRGENIDRAIACYQLALEVRTREDFPQDWATTQNNLANAYSDKITGNRGENIDRAIACYQLALEVRTREDFPFNNVQTLNNLGWAYLAKQEINPKTQTLQSAYDTFKDAITGADSLRKLIKSSDEIKQKHDVEWDRLYMGMVQVCLDRNSNQEALIYAETNKARNLAELIAQKQEIPETLEAITFEKITQLLTTDTALIEWYITDEEIITFVLTSPDTITVHRSRQRDELIDLVNEYREEYQKSKTHWQPQLPDYLQRLADILEITTILPAASQRLILIPHWYLHLFPLHALPLGDDEFLLDKFPQGIQYGPSCQLLQQIKIHRNFDQLLALQNPTLDLYFTDLEVTSIAPKFAIREVIPGVNASKDNLFGPYLAQLEDAHCAHFSCHGSFNANDPLRSFLILAGGLEPPQPPLVRGEQEENEESKVPLNKGDLGGAHPEVPLNKGDLGGSNPEVPLSKGDLEGSNPEVPLNKGDLEGSNPEVPLSKGDLEGSNPEVPLNKGDLEGSNPEVPLNKGDLGGSNPEVPLNKGDLGGRYATWRDGKTADITKCLTLEEIFQLKLKQCRLVVLSACETALIDTESRSDYIGLPTGFLHAGAMGTLASLWAVNDLSTALIMVKFYEELQPEVSIGQALHDTQLWFKSAYTSDLKEWVRTSSSFDDEQKEAIEDQLGGYGLNVKPYGSIYHWGAFCAIGL